MKRLVSWLLLIAMLAVVGLWSSLPTEAQEEEAAPQCNCYYPKYRPVWGDKVGGLCGHGLLASHSEV